MKPELQSKLYNGRPNISSKSGLAYKKETGTVTVAGIPQRLPKSAKDLYCLICCKYLIGHSGKYYIAFG